MLASCFIGYQIGSYEKEEKMKRELKRRERERKDVDRFSYSDVHDW
jgi:hypothetical protein